MKNIILTLPLTKALDIGYDQATGVGTAATRGESLEGSKATKNAVGYEHPAQGPNHCSQCEHLLAPHDCERVEGIIQPEDWCQLWNAKES